MNDEQLLRFSRHILLDEIGIEGQSKIIASHALVIGAGGLGSPAALYLASAGVGRITLAGGGTVGLTHLQRPPWFGGRAPAVGDPPPLYISPRLASAALRWPTATLSTSPTCNARSCTPRIALAC